MAIGPKWSPSLHSALIGSVGLGLVLASVTLGVPPASAESFTLTVVDAVTGLPLPDAIVTVVDIGVTANTVASKTTDAQGEVAVGGQDLPCGTCTISVSKGGYATKLAAAGDVRVELSGGLFNPLPVYGGRPRAFAADAQPGVLYGLMDGAPELWRSVDYGATWESVPMEYDVAGGLSGLNSKYVTTSSVPGEVAVLSGRFFDPGPEVGGPYEVMFVSYSKDFGLNWDEVDLPVGVTLPTSNSLDPFVFSWSHNEEQSDGSDASVLLLATQTGNQCPSTPDPEMNEVPLACEGDAGDWNVWYADMAEAPSITRQDDHEIGNGDLIDVVTNEKGAYVGRLSVATGESGPNNGVVDFALLTTSGIGAFDFSDGGTKIAVGAIPAPSSPNGNGTAGLLRMGGATQANGLPDTLLVVGDYGARTEPIRGDEFTAALVTADGFVKTAQTQIDSHCGIDFLAGSVAPVASPGSVANANLGNCWLSLIASPPPPDTISGESESYELTQSDLIGLNRPRLVYDPEYGVGVHPTWVAYGVTHSTFRKATALVESEEPDAGKPDFEHGDDLRKGIAALSFASVAYGPDTLTDTNALLHSVSLFVSPMGGSGAYASRDGGQTLTLTGNGSGVATRWWKGASGNEWLVYGLATAFADPLGTETPALLAAANNWSLTDPPFFGSNGNVAGTSPEDLNCPDPCLSGITALQEVPDSDQIFVGVGDKVILGTLSDISITEGSALGFDFSGDKGYSLTVGGYQPRSFGFCAAGPMAETLWVAAADASGDSRGGLYQVPNAFDGTPELIPVAGRRAPSGAGMAIGVDCANGIVYAGGSDGLWRGVASTAGVEVSYRWEKLGGLPNVWAIGVDPAFPEKVTVTDFSGSFVVQSKDSGLTWGEAYNSLSWRSLGIRAITYPPAPPAVNNAVSTRSQVSAALLTQATGGIALVGSSAGAFTADFAAEPEGGRGGSHHDSTGTPTPATGLGVDTGSTVGLSVIVGALGVLLVGMSLTMAGARLRREA